MTQADEATTTIGPAAEGPGRPLMLRDVMVLTAAIGLGLGLARFLANPSTIENGGWEVARAAWSVALPLTWVVAAFGMAGGRRSRSTPPGVAACIGVAAASAVMLATAAQNLAAPDLWSSTLRWMLWLNWARDPGAPAAAIAGLWLVQAWDLRWQPEAGWADRAGRGLGCFWLASALAMPVLRLFDR